MYRCSWKTFLYLVSLTVGGFFLAVYLTWHLINLGELLTPLGGLTLMAVVVLLGSAAMRSRHGFARGTCCAPEEFGELEDQLPWDTPLEVVECTRVGFDESFDGYFRLVRTREWPVQYFTTRTGSIKPPPGRFIITDGKIHALEN